MNANRYQIKKKTEKKKENVYVNLNYEKGIKVCVCVRLKNKENFHFKNTCAFNINVRFIALS